MRAFHYSPGRESARRDVEYATVRATLANRTDKAVLLSRDDLLQAVWVPKSKLEIGSRVQAEKAVMKTEVSLRIELDFALAQHLV